MKKLITVSLAAAFAFVAFASTTIVSCCKQPGHEPSCFDQALKNKYKNAMCTADCPGVTGCDGKTYCNSCEAARQGIKVKS